MKVYIKNKAAFKTIAAADVLSSNICMDSSDGQTSSIKALGDYSPSYADQWAVLNGQLFLISKVSPDKGTTQFTLSEPLEALSRPLVYIAPADGVSSGQHLAQVIQIEFVDQPDPDYSLPYLSVSGLDTGSFIPPEVNDKGIYSLPAYIRLLRQLTGVKPEWAVSGNTLKLTFVKTAHTARQIVFNDGHAQLKSRVYSRSGVAKLTVRHEQADGSVLNIIYYLAADGSVSTEPPDHRAAGQWDIITVTAKQDPLLKAQETFLKNKKSHKVEFYSDREYQIMDPVSLALNGEVLSSYISYKGKVDNEKRWLYKSGELATTATEILKGR